jgi:hypothetical protein
VPQMRRKLGGHKKQAEWQTLHRLLRQMED